MKYLLIAAAAALAASSLAISATPANTQTIVCHNDPECQRLRNSGNLKAAQARANQVAKQSANSRTNSNLSRRGRTN